MNKGERNYHSFYHLAAAAPADERKRLGLEKGPDGFAYLSPGKCAERPPPPPPPPHRLRRRVDDPTPDALPLPRSEHTIASMPDDEFYKLISSCLKTCGLSDETLREVYAIVAAVLHIGNSTFEGDEEAKLTSSDGGKAIELLGADVSNSFVQRTMKVGMEMMQVPLNPEKAAHARDALAKTVYQRLFEWVVNQVNKKIAGTAAPDSRFIGLLDVFGFEIFEVNLT